MCQLKGGTQTQRTFPELSEKASNKEYIESTATPES